MTHKTGHNKLFSGATLNVDKVFTCRLFIVTFQAIQVLVHEIRPFVFVEKRHENHVVFEIITITVRNVDASGCRSVGQDNALELIDVRHVDIFVLCYGS